MKPKIIITLDATQIKSFLTCPHSWVYGYVERLTFHRSKMIYLDRGTFVHKLLEVFYVLRSLDPKEDRFTHAQLVIDLVKTGRLMERTGLEKSDEAFICQRFLQYVMKWIAYDFVPQKRDGIPGVEVGFSKILSETEDWLFVVEGKIDLLSHTSAGELCFADNKTQEKLNDLYGWKPQFLTYAWATGYHFGVVNYFRLAQKYEDQTTFRRDMFYYDDRQIKAWSEKMMRIFKAIYKQMRTFGYTNTDEFSKLAMYGQLDLAFERNESACAGAYESSPCFFSAICKEPPSLYNGIKQTYYSVGKKWSPWTP